MTGTASRQKYCPAPGARLNMKLAPQNSAKFGNPFRTSLTKPLLRFGRCVPMERHHAEAEIPRQLNRSPASSRMRHDDCRTAVRSCEKKSFQVLNRLDSADKSRLDFVFRPHSRLPELQVLSSAGFAQNARPSPCALTTGRTAPAIPVKRIDGDGKILTLTKRASNCSERFLSKDGQCCAPGIKDFN